MTLRQDIRNLQLRRALFGGYRPADVEVLAAHWRSAVDVLEAEVRRARERAAELEEDLRTLRTRLESYIARESELNKALANAHAQAQAIEDQAHGNARRILAEAEERAAQLRLEGFARIAETGNQIDELLRARDSLLGTVRAAVGEFDSLLARIDLGAVRADVPAPRAETFAAPTPPPAPAPAAPTTQNIASEGDRDRVYEGRVEVEVGPFLDFAALSAFERALARLGGIEDVYVRRFVDDRATIEVTLGGPVQLVRAMAADLPFGFEVHSTDSQSLSMTLHTMPPLRVG